MIKWEKIISREPPKSVFSDEKKYIWIISQFQQSQQLNGAWNSYNAQQQSFPNLSNRTDIGQTTITLSNLNHQPSHTPSALPSQIPAAHNQSQVQSMQQQQNYQQQPQQQQQPPPPPPAAIGQENIVRVFDELMKNIARMKMFVRPSMCKPYGKQSESLQKSKYKIIAQFNAVFC